MTEFGSCNNSTAREFWIWWRRLIWDLGGCSKGTYSNRVWNKRWRWQWYKLLWNWGKDRYNEAVQYNNSKLWRGPKFGGKR